jgi:hypothetical protein
LCRYLEEAAGDEKEHDRALELLGRLRLERKAGEDKWRRELDGLSKAAEDKLAKEAAGRGGGFLGLGVFGL